MDIALFNQVSKGEKMIPIEEFRKYITESGISLDDQRLVDVLAPINQLKEIDFVTFSEAVNKSSLLYRVMHGELVVPEWDEFTKIVEEIFEQAKECNEGEKSTLTPRMQRADENLFAVSICSIDGQRLQLGDTKVDFCTHSCSKVPSYLLAVEENGSEYVHKYVGKEPFDATYNYLQLKEINDGCNASKFIPHNPFCDAGAILISSLISKDLPDSERFFRICEVFRKSTASEKIGFSHESFLSERDASDRRSCMAFMMRESNSFPEKINISNVLELYFQLRSIELNTEQMSVMAATLANGGVCPLTEETVFDIVNVRDCLSLMLSCGMYHYSGEWAFKIGLPAKSAISGCVFIVIPNKMGISIFSPKLDKIGNSVRALRFAELLVDRFSFHHLDNTRSFGEGKQSQPCQLTLPVPGQPPSASLPHADSSGDLSALMNAAETGDIDELRGLVTDSVDLMQKNYDRRTALHLAAANNYPDLVRYLVLNEYGEARSSEELSVQDRWGLTPLDVAESNGATEVIQILLKYNAKRGKDLD